MIVGSLRSLAIPRRRSTSFGLNWDDSDKFQHFQTQPKSPRSLSLGISETSKNNLLSTRSFIESSETIEEEGEDVLCELIKLPPRRPIVPFHRPLLHAPKRIYIRVGRVLFETRESTLSAYPKTLLGNPNARRVYYDRGSNEFRFGRCEHAFDAILFYYQSHGILCRPSSVKRTLFLQELEFFQIDIDLDNRHRTEKAYIEEQERESRAPDSNFKRFIWRDLMCKSRTSFSKLVIAFYMATVLLSVIIVCLETVPPWTSRKEYWYILEIYVSTIFTIEYLLRLYLATEKLYYAISSPGIMDLFTVVCALTYVGLYKTKHRGGLMKALSFFRVIRIFKFTKISQGLEQVLRVLYACRHHVFVFVGSALMACFFFSTIIHTLEETNFHNKDLTFFDVFWYSIITATNVGYGDIYPITIPGKLFGGLLAIFGVIIFCLPATQLVYKFVELYYLPHIFREDMDERRRDIIIKTREGFFADMEGYAAS